MKGRPQSIRRLLLVSFVLIALVPVSFLGTRLYRAAWDNAWREIHEKHRLLALNLGSPLRIYVKAHRNVLGMLDLTIADVGDDPDTVARNTRLLQQTLARTRDFRALILMDAYDRARIVARSDGSVARDTDTYTIDPIYVDTLMSESPGLSGAKFSALDGEPTVLVSQPVHDAGGAVIGVLLGELDVAVIDALRKRIEFGEGGHSVIVDQTGHVIAHPNAEWMSQLRDLSSARVVQRMLSGESGVTEFFSPWVGEDMVAGFTGVPDIGWGVMVPQPKHEVETQVRSLLASQLMWAGAGLGLAVVFAVLLSHWITRPINRLARSANRLVANDYQGSLPSPPKRTPLEVRQLDAALRDLIDGLQDSREEVGQLNKSLQRRIDEATEQLRETNAQLVEALRKADEFVSFARHDLRKPIAVITDVADSLFEKKRTDALDERELPEMLDLVKRSAAYMKNIVDDFLGQQTIAAGKIELHTEPASLNDIVRLMVRSNRDYAKRKGITLHTKLDDSLGAVEIDVARISQVCQNLIDNAIKFCSEGDQVYVHARTAGAAVEVRVCDTGPGLSAADVPKLFRKNVKLSNAPTGGEVSTGLGLVLCKEIIELHDGEIGAETNPDGGACFWFRLPAAAACSQHLVG